MIKSTVFYSLLVLALGWAWFEIHQPDVLPIRGVRIYANYKHINPEVLQKTATPFVQSGFFAIDVAGLKNSLLALPWVANIGVSRIWPDIIVIKIQEQVPNARWGEAGLLARNGDLFYPELSTIPADLPMLQGPEGQHEEVFEQWKKFNHILSALGLHIIQLELTPRTAWEGELDNGMQLLLGRLHPQKRLRRFVGSYNRLFGSHGSDAERIDLRYPNGIAIKYKT